MLLLHCLPIPHSRNNQNKQVGNLATTLHCDRCAGRNIINNQYSPPFGYTRMKCAL